MRENQGRRIAQAEPPIGGRMKLFESAAIGLLHEAEDIEIGVAGGVFAGDGGTIKDDRLEVIRGGVLETGDEFSEFCFHGNAACRTGGDRIAKIRRRWKSRAIRK